jgi:hypothetical protein
MEKLEFKGTKGEWTYCEHNWSDTTIYANNESFTVASMSIYDELTGDNQDELENEMQANAKLISASKELLESLVDVMESSEKFGFNSSGRRICRVEPEIWEKAIKAIEKALK